MLDHVRDRGSDRKLRLFACACCRRVWDVLDDDKRQVVRLMERFVDGLATVEEMRAQAALALPPRPPHGPHPLDKNRVEAGCRPTLRLLGALLAGFFRSLDEKPRPRDAGGNARDAVYFAVAEDHVFASSVPAYHAAVNASVYGARAVADAAVEHEPEEDRRKAAEASEKFAQAELVRDIFGNPFRPVAVNPLSLAVGIRDLAGSIYDQQDFDRMPALAEALVQVDGVSAELLAHCRSEGPHARGCWAVDLLLGKE
jgi:hypothetical protein